MSQYHVYVRAKDGNIYTRPRIQGQNWFICWDDDDDPELVVHATSEAEASLMMARIAESVDYIGPLPNRFCFRGGRMTGCPKGMRSFAKSFDLIAPVPVPHGQQPATKRKPFSVIWEPVQEPNQ